jgi:hypothetical protein
MKGETHEMEHYFNHHRCCYPRNSFNNEENETIKQAKHLQ